MKYTFHEMLWKEYFTVYPRLITYLIKLILYDNDVKLLNFKRIPVSVDLWCACVRFSEAVVQRCSVKKMFLEIS